MNNKEREFKTLNAYETSAALPKGNTEHAEALQQEVDQKRKAYIESLPQSVQNKFDIIENIIIPLLEKNQIQYTLHVVPDKQTGMLVYGKSSYAKLFSDAWQTQTGTFLNNSTLATLQSTSLQMKYLFACYDNTDPQSPRIISTIALGKTTNYEKN